MSEYNTTESIAVELGCEITCCADEVDSAVKFRARTTHVVRTMIYFWEQLWPRVHVYAQFYCCRSSIASYADGCRDDVPLGPSH